MTDQTRAASLREEGDISFWQISLIAWLLEGGG
jgi:hypothetical protein